jgi:hypothetical protein
VNFSPTGSRSGDEGNKHRMPGIALDYHCMFALELEQWKKKSGHSLQTWLNVIGKWEGISSLAKIK